ncbi:LuxR C-terminal-related transcriptional regulator [Aeromonas veronii]|nr:response regulator transcription factor [Aeromonas sobria]
MIFCSRIVLIDEVPIFEIALKQLFIDSGIHFDIVGHADNGVDGISLIRTLHPDVIVIDIEIKFISVFDMIKRAKAINKKIKVIVFGILRSDHLKYQLLCSGADVCIDKRSRLEYCIHDFKLVFSDSFSNNNHLIIVNEMKAIHNAHSLSSRETLVLKHLALGERNHEIAERLNLSPKTISTYKCRIENKLGTKSIFELRNFAIKNKLI